MKLDALSRQLEDEFGELSADAVQALPGKFEVQRPVARRSAMPARGSTGTTTTRLFITSTSTTCAACFIAYATASASPLRRWKARLPGASSQIAGAPAASAALPSTTAGSDL